MTSIFNYRIRPTTVNLALALLVLSLFLGLITVIYNLNVIYDISLDGGDSFVVQMELLIDASIIIVMGLSAFFIALRSAVARIMFVLIFLLGAGFRLYWIIALITDDYVLLGILMLRMGMQFLAMAFLFSPSANHWFRQMRDFSVD